jgi:uncharacterized protein (DUF58 family)
MIQPQFLQQLERFNLSLKKQSSEKLEGDQKSHETGSGMIFKDHKKYIPGDDIRRVDWKAYARTNELYVKRFEEERSVTVHVLVDRSSSMDYGDPNKYEYSAKLGAGIAYLSAKTNDRFRFSLFSETVSNMGSSRRDPNMAHIINKLNDIGTTPESRLKNCVESYSKQINNQSIVVIISDFLTDTEQVEDSLGLLKGSDTVLVQTLSDKEVEPEMQGEKILEDPESDSMIRTFLSKKIRKNYKSRITSHNKKVEQLADKHGSEYIYVNTREDFFESFQKVWNSISDR